MDLLEIIKDRLKSPVLRFRLWRARKDKLQVMKSQWQKTQDDRKVQQWLDRFGSQREIRDFHMFRIVPGRYRG